MILKRIIEFRNDKDPCDECLVSPMCKSACMPKFAYHSRRRTLFSMLSKRLELTFMGILFLLAVPGLVFILDFSKHLLIPAAMIIAVISFFTVGFLDVKLFSPRALEETEKIRRLVEKSPWLEGKYGRMSL
jgi:hypothetical protein